MLTRATWRMPTGTPRHGRATCRGLAREVRAGPPTIRFACPLQRRPAAANCTISAEPSLYSGINPTCVGALAIRRSPHRHRRSSADVERPMRIGRRSLGEAQRIALSRWRRHVIHGNVGFLDEESLLLPSDVLRPLSIVEGTVVWALYYPRPEGHPRESPKLHDPMVRSCSPAGVPVGRSHQTHRSVCLESSIGATVMARSRTVCTENALYRFG
jgi:hypothetical protein